MRRLPFLASLSLICCTGCHSAFIDATLINSTPHPISLVELDYPSASFGTQTLAPNETFHYRFKVLGNGPTKLLYTNPGLPERDEKSDGPTLHDGDEGTLLVTITPTGTHWLPTLHRR